MRRWIDRVIKSRAMARTGRSVPTSLAVCFRDQRQQLIDLGSQRLVFTRVRATSRVPADAPSAVEQHDVGIVRRIEAHHLFPHVLQMEEENKGVSPFACDVLLDATTREMPQQGRDRFEHSDAKHGQTWI
jgi:hypothetical protein